MRTAEALATYADDLSFGDLDAAAIEATKVRLLDALACSFAAMAEPSVKTVCRHLRGRPGEEARFVGGGASSVENAAFANTTLVRYVIWNDTVTPGGHPSDNFGPVISVADAVDATGEELVLASVLAYEIQCSLADCHDTWISDDGIDSSTYGLPPAALSAAKLLDLSTEEMTQAVNMAVSGNVSLGQRSRGEISDFSGMATANAARNGVFSALLAGEGITGPAPVWEGEQGLNNLLTDNVEVDIDAFGGDGTPFQVTRTNLKPYPCFTDGQAPVDCAIELVEAHDIQAADVISIEAETYRDAVGRPGEWQPESREVADHSVPWLIARAFVDGEVTLSQFRRNPLVTEETAALMERITVTVNEAFEARYPRELPHHLTVETTDGVYEASTARWRGHHENPLSRENIEEKFRSQFEVVHGGDPQPLIDWVWSLETHDSVDGLFEHTALP